MATDLKKFAEENGIRFFLISFTDLFGVTRSKLVPTAAIAGMFALPDADCVIQLPWKKEVAWVPDDNRIECRLPDGAANPYLLQAAIAGAALHGVRHKTDPGARYDIDMYADGHMVKDAPRLPLNMVDAMRRFEGSGIFPSFLGQELCDADLKLKRIKWTDFMHHFSEWERRNGLDV
jgi:glutamine synthetase